MSVNSTPAAVVHVENDVGVQANSRLTSSMGIVLLVLLAVEGATLLSLGRFLRWHEVIGIVLIPPILLKLATTGYRFVRYYTGDAAYGKKGPPHWILRLSAPGMIVVTVILFVTGLELTFVHRNPWWVGFGHKASFVLWFGAMTIHVLGHVRESLTVGTADWRPGSIHLKGTGLRRAALMISLVAGVLACLALLPQLKH